MKKNIAFLSRTVRDIKEVTASYNGLSAIYRRVGDVSRCQLVGRGNARQIKHILKEFIRSAKGVDG